MSYNSTKAGQLIGVKCALLLSLLLSLITEPLLAQAPVTKLWDKTFGGSGRDNVYFHSLINTPDGGYLVAGNSTSNAGGDKTEDSRGDDDFWIVKLNADGSKAWDRTFGGSGSDELRSAILTADGGYLLGGWSDSNAGGDKTEDSRGDDDFWIVKLNADGSKAWDRTFGGSGSDALLSITETVDGEYLLGGYSSSNVGVDKSYGSKGEADFWVIKIDTNGNKIWDKVFGGSGWDTLSSINRTADGGYILGGMSDSGVGGDKSEDSRDELKYTYDYWIIKLNSDYSIAWDKTIGGSGGDDLYDIITTSDGGYLLGGHSNSVASGEKTGGSRNGDYWVVKLNADGSKAWDKSLGGKFPDYLRSLIKTPDGGFLIGGASTSDADGDKSEPSRGSHDFWIVKLNADGSKAWDKVFGGNGFDSFSTLIPTKDGNYLMVGHSDSDANGDKTDASKGDYDYWVVKIAVTSPVITTHPVAKTITGGQNTSFSVTASGPGALLYQWQVSKDGGRTYSNISNGLGYSGVTAPTLSITKAPISMNGYQYRVQVSNGEVVISKAALLTVNVPSFDNNRSWQVVGNPGFSSGPVGALDLSLDLKDTPFVSYVDDHKATVKKYNGSNWVDVGTPGFNEDWTTYNKLALGATGAPYLAYQDWANDFRASVKTFYGTNWIDVGTAGFSEGRASYTSLAINDKGVPYIAYRDHSYDFKVVVKKFSGDVWESVGSATVSAGESEFIDLKLDGNNTPYVAYMDYAYGNKASVMKFDGTNWVYLGTPGFTKSFAQHFSLALDHNGTLYMAFGDGAYGAKVSVMKFDGKSWISVGAPGISVGEGWNPSLVLDGSGVPFVSYTDHGVSGKAKVKKFNGDNWIEVGSTEFTNNPGHYTSLAVDASGVPYLSYSDKERGDKATVMKFDGTAPVITTHPISKTITGGQNTSFSVAASGTNLTYQWQVSKDGGVSFNNISNGLGYSGATTATLSITKAPISMNGYQYRVQVSNGEIVTSNAATLTVNVPAFDNMRVWQVVGEAGISAGVADRANLALDANGIPFVAYRDEAIGGKATVMKFNGSNWAPVGTRGFSAGAAYYNSLALNAAGTPYVAYLDQANGSKTTVMKYDGLRWVNVGTPSFSAGAAHDQSLILDQQGIPYVVYHDLSNSDRATVMKFNGTSWVPVGARGFSADGAYNTSLALDGNGMPYIAFFDGSNGRKATVMKFDGNNWVYLGTKGISADEASSISLSLDVNGTPYIAYSDYGIGQKAVVKRYNGSSWTAVGTLGISPGRAYNTSLALDEGGTPYVSFWDGTNGAKATVMKFNGKDWVFVGVAGFSAGTINSTSLVLDDKGTPYIAFQDGANGNKATVMKFAVSSNPDLANLTVAPGTLAPVFAASTTSYASSVAHDVASVNLTATLADPTRATMTVNGSVVTSGSTVAVNVAVGTNLIPVLVTAQDGTTKTYTVSVTRAAAPVNEALTIWQGTMSSDWHDAGNWSNGVPTSTKDAVIRAGGSYMPVVLNTSEPSAAYVARNLTIETGATLDLRTILDLHGNLTNNGTFTSYGNKAGDYYQSSSLVVFHKPATIGGSKPLAFYQLNLETGALVTLATDITVLHTLSLRSDLNTGNKKLTLLSEKGYWINVENLGGVVNGAATVQRYIDSSLNAGKGYRHFASPVVSTTVADLTTSGFTPVVNGSFNTAADPSIVKPYPTVFGYDESRLKGSNGITSGFEHGWYSPQATSDRLVPGLGYSVNIAASAKVDFVGTLNNGNITVSSLGKGTPAAAGWHLLGNPYPSSLTWSALEKPSGMQNAIYVYRSSGTYDGSYISYVNGIGNEEANTIAAMQGFFVRVTQGPVNFTFTNAARTSQEAHVLRTAQDQRPQLQLQLSSAAGRADEAFIYFQPEASAEVSGSFDAYKVLTYHQDKPTLFARLGEEKLSIKGLPLNNQVQVLPLEMYVPADGSYTFSAAKLVNFPAVAEVVLEDKETGQSYHLNQTKEVTLALTTATDPHRFVLRFSAVAGSPLSSGKDLQEGQQVLLYPNPTQGDVTLRFAGTKTATPLQVVLYNSIGQVVLTKTIHAEQAQAGETLPTAGLARGVYHLQVQVNGRLVTKKLVLQK